MGSVFLVNVPVMGLLLAAGPKLLPERRDADASRLDLVSAVLSLLAVEAARDTLGSAREMTGAMRPGVDAELLAAARDAFVQGLQVAASLGAALALAAAVVAARMLRQSQTDATSPTRQTSEPARAVAASSPQSVGDRSCA